MRYEFNEYDAVLPDEDRTRDQESGVRRLTRGRDGGGTGRSDHCWCSLKPVCVISGDCTGMHMASCVIYKSSLALPHAGTPVVKGTPPENPLKLQSHPFDGNVETVDGVGFCAWPRSHDPSH
ncbi:unnamed protein product [Boreogadus saida]